MRLGKLSVSFAIGGARWTYLDLDVEFEGGPLGGVELDRSRDWIDPYVGLRARYDFTRNLNATVMGTIGGFGLASDSTWSASALLEYRIWRKLGVYAGYRAMGWDYDRDDFVWNVTLQGPVAGLTFRW